MSQDFGARPSPRRSGPKLTLIIGGVAVAALAVFLVVEIGRMDRAKAVASAQAWTVDGPPCPTLPRAALAAQPEAPRNAFTDYDVRFARASGNVSCNEIKSDGGRGGDTVPVCKFNSPDLLEISSGAADVVFGPRLFGLVIVTVPHGQPRCVVVPRERVADMMANF